jgi:tetrahydromethanopterin S-methyltransferase subunit G
MSWFLEEIEKLQYQIEILRPQAISDLRTEMAEALNRVDEIERHILEFTGSITSDRAIKRVGIPIGITIAHRQVHRERKDHVPTFTQPVSSRNINSVPRLDDARDQQSGGRGIAPKEVSIYRGEICAGVHGPIGQNTDATDIKWEESYSKLFAFREKFGHLRLPIQNPDFQHLNEWLREQKTRHASLRPDQVRRLLALGVSFGGKETVWYRQFFDLCDYVKVHDAFPQRRTSLARWVEYQRIRKNKGNLPLNRTRWLDSLGIVWKADIRRNVFVERLQELKAFREIHGHCNVPWDYSETPGLGHYVGKLRSEKESRSPDEIRELDAIGFIWDVLEDTWQKHLAELKEFLEQHRTYPTQLTNPRLASWVRSQRKLLLSPERLHQLDEIGFPWNPREEVWMSRYLELKAYRQQFGHCRVPYDGEHQQLWKWMHFQKTCRTELSPKRRKLLDRLGIDWSIEERSSTDDRMDELNAYYRTHGHCNVSASENPSLAAWLGRVRRRKKRLPDAIKKKLESMGLDWSPGTTLWNQRFAEVAAFKERFGHCRIPARWEGNTVLATWLYTQKRRWERLSAERRQHLAALDPSIGPSDPYRSKAWGAAPVF